MSKTLVIVEGLMADDFKVHVLDVATGTRLRTIKAATRVTASFFDGKQIVLGDDEGNLYFYDALTGADALLVVTEWSEFRRPDFDRMRELLKHPVIIDGRNIYEPDVMRTHGFTYVPIGRAAVRS